MFKLAAIDCCYTFPVLKDKYVFVCFLTVKSLMTHSVCHILSQAQFHHHSAVLCLNQYLMIIDCNFGQQPLSLSESVTHTNLNHFYQIYDYIEYSIGLYTKFNEVCALSRKIYQKNQPHQLNELLLLKAQCCINKIILIIIRLIMRTYPPCWVFSV